MATKVERKKKRSIQTLPETACGPVKKLLRMVGAKSGGKRGW